MFIKFNDLDLFEFFESEPVSIGDEDEAKYIYSIKSEHNLSMTLTIDTYANQIDISIGYDNNTIFAGQFNSIVEIKKSQDVLLVEMEENKRLIVKKKSCLGVVIECI